MILIVVGGLKPERQKLAKLIGANIPNLVIRRSIYQPIKTVVSENDPTNKLTLIEKNLPYIGDTTDFMDHSNSELMTKVETVKDTFELCFSKEFMINHFNVGLTPQQYFRRSASKDRDKPIFIIDDIERKDDLSFMYDNLKQLCLKADRTLGKGLFTSMKELMKKGGVDLSEADKIRAHEEEMDYYRSRHPDRLLNVEPEILTIVIKNEDNSISQVYPGATIKTMDDLPSNDNVIEISSKDLNENLKSFSMLLYNIFYKEAIKKEFN